MLSIHTHTRTHTCTYTSLPPHFPSCAFGPFLGLSLRLFRLLLRLVSLPQSRAKYSLFSLLLPFSLALLALLFLCFFLLFLRLFRYLFRLFARAPQSGTVCVCVCQTLFLRAFHVGLVLFLARGSNLIQRSWVTGKEVVEDAQPCTC